MERLRAELVRNQNGQGNFRPLGRKNDPYIISDSDSDHEDSKSSKKPSSHNPGGTIYASLAPASSYYRPPAPGAIQMPVPHPAPAPRIPAPTLSSTSKLSAFTPSPASSSTAAAYSSRSSNIFSGDSEELQMPQIGPSGYDPNEYKSSEEAQKELLDLVHGAMGADLDVDPEMAFVEGFAKGIKLLPHQIQGRTWMTERESGKKWGGILGDDVSPP
ncbi:hypothetical protein FRC02_010383 [Tulasnella sp. 418]|nr:hypothetical protein FRC02_010383 [Tulasnella sp. 418]